MKKWDMGSKRDVYDLMKAFRFPEKIIAIKENRVTPPIHVRIKPTNSCNHSCWFCAYRVDGLYLGEEMNTRDRIPPLKMDEIVRDPPVSGKMSLNQD